MSAERSRTALWIALLLKHICGGAMDGFFPQVNIRPVHGVPSQSMASMLSGSANRSFRPAQNMESSI